MGLRSSGLPEKIQKLGKIKLCKNIVVRAKAQKFAANYVVEMNDKVNETFNDNTGYTRYEFFIVQKYKYFFRMTSTFIFLSSQETVDIDNESEIEREREREKPDRTLKTPKKAC